MANYGLKKVFHVELNKHFSNGLWHTWKGQFVALQINMPENCPTAFIEKPNVDF
jgi:hypothetical protein